MALQWVVVVLAAATAATGGGRIRACMRLVVNGIRCGTESHRRAHGHHFYAARAPARIAHRAIVSAFTRVSIVKEHLAFRIPRMDGCVRVCALAYGVSECLHGSSSIESGAVDCARAVCL